MSPRTDPIIIAIDNFRAGLAMFNVIPGVVIEKLEEQIIEATYGPPMQVLIEWTAPAITFDGAVAALKMAVEENGLNASSDIAGNMTIAALTFFEMQEANHAA